MIWVLVAACLIAALPSGLRWLRVAQREHYLADGVNRFALRWWWQTTWLNRVLHAAALIGAVSVIFDIRTGLLVPIVAAVGPIGLSIRGETSPLVWTGRLGRVAFVTGSIVLLGLVLGALLDRPFIITLTLFGLPVIVDLSLWMLAPYERRRGRGWVKRATAKLEVIAPDVVAITGSYGKTTTKNYVAHLLAGSRRVVASPASFNNRMGLARAINENLTPGTDVFVAEMGTYTPGEIAELCEWIPPKVAAIVAIGPVHLERFRTLERIVAAKAEILDRAEVGVISVDDPLLDELVSSRLDDMPIVTVSTRGGIMVDGERVIDEPEGVFAVNLAVALGICRALGVDLAEVLPRTTNLPTAEHRQSILESSSGFTIIDDTFNSNPEGARSAVETLVRVADGGRTVVITPGMVELGRLQAEENRKFAATAAQMVDDLVIVGRTNRKALQAGSAIGKASVTVVDSRAEAVEWVKANLGHGDVVLYENDLPDHYP